jgi:putative sterol carrier protein
MGEATTEFLEGLAQRGHEPLLETTTGTLRLDLLKNGAQKERWLLSFDKGEVAVSHKSGATDCTIRAPEALFDGVSRGEVNPLAAVLRGEMSIEGDSRLLVRFQRLLPSPPRAASRRPRAARKARKR